MQNIKCSQCLQIFNLNKKARRLPSCSHSICQTCLIEAILCKNTDLICTYCSSITPKEQIQMFPINQDILLSQSSLNEGKTKQIKRQSQNEGNIDKDIFLLQVQDEEEKLLEQDDQQNQEESEEDNICTIHKNIKDIICISDKQTICPHCALFGNHKDHLFTRLTQFSTQISSKTIKLTSILKQKQNILQKNIQQLLRTSVSRKKAQILKQVEKSINESIRILRQKEDLLKEQINNKFVSIENICKLSNVYKNYDKVTKQFQKWEGYCIQSINKIKHTTFSKKIQLFYGSPLENISQGQNYLKDLKEFKNQMNKLIVNKVQGISLSIDKNFNKYIENCIKLKARQNEDKMKKTQKTEQVRIDAFLDCTSSQIGMNSRESSTFIHNTSIGDIQNITSSYKKIPNDELRKATSLKSFKSLNKIQAKIDQNKKLTQSNNNLKLIQQTSKSKINLRQQVSPKLRLQQVKSKIVLKKPKETLLEEFLLQTQTKQYDSKRAQSILQQFSKNKFADFLDLSECNLPNEKILQYVQKAKGLHKLKSLKLSSNKLNIIGFQKLLPLLKGMNNLNLSNNLINENILELLLKNKDRLDILKVINLAHNPIKFQKRMSTKIEELKKLGVMVIL